jgi:hypothetical protein
MFLNLKYGEISVMLHYLFLSILFHSTPVTCFALGEGAFSGVSGLFSLSKRADFDAGLSAA